jgi:hypothetical protein
MALPQKPTEPTTFICLNDTALDALPQDQVVSYARSRDIKDLNLSLCTAEDKPVIFHMKPLNRKFNDTINMPEPSDLFRVFCWHCIEIDNNPWPELKWEETTSGKYLKNDDYNWNQLPESVYVEIASAVIQRASKGDDNLAPFISPDTWYRERQIRSIRLHAKKASVPGSETAKPTSSATD